jgi:hypothetical protein
MIKTAPAESELLNLMRGSKAQRNKALGTIYKNNKEKACSYISPNRNALIWLMWLEDST